MADTVHLTVGYPMKKYDNTMDIDELRNTITEMIDQFQYILCNLSAGNVVEAASVKAQNIDCTKAQIQDAQIKNLTANKLTAGTIDTGQITIKNSESDKSVELSDSYLVFADGSTVRAAMGYNTSGQFVFVIYDNTGENVQIGLDDGGTAVFRGKIISDASIDVHTDVRVGQNIYVGYNTYNQYDDGTIYFGKPVVGQPRIKGSSDGIVLSAMNGVYVGNNQTSDNKIATQGQINALQDQINNLKSGIAPGV